jgi:glycine/D-amino acid oxidase-like deaminating enzyme
MVNVDYIIVGCGLASIAFCEHLRANNKSYIVFDDSSQKSSLVAAGLYNPVILKRFTKVWKSREQLEIALPVYQKIEEDLKIKIDHKLKLLRRFASIEEQNMWFTASDKPNLEPYLSAKILKNDNKFINAPFGYGEVLHAGRLDTEELINGYKDFLREKNSLMEAGFNHDILETNSNNVTYQNITAKYVVFAEGFGVKKNPFFKFIPLNGTKGEVLTIKAPDLKIDYGVKSSVFIIPIEGDTYYVGATYNWKDKTQLPTDAGKDELITKLKTFITCDFEVVNHQAGVRPTVTDRRPLIGKHPEINRLFVMNGLGSRGVMIAPYVAEKLYNFIENGAVLDAEININRFTS